MIRLFTLIAMVVALVTDFRKTRKFYKEKALHAIALTYMIYNYSTSFAYLGGLIRRGSEEVAKYHFKVGFLSPDFNVVVWVCQLVSSCLILYAAIGLTQRKERSRKLLLFLLPFSTVIEAFGFYRGFVSEGDDGINHYVILATGFVIMGLVYGSIYLLYRSKMIISFFAAKETAKPIVSDETSTTT